MIGVKQAIPLSLRWGTTWTKPPLYESEESPPGSAASPVCIHIWMPSCQIWQMWQKFEIICVLSLTDNIIQWTHFSPRKSLRWRTGSTLVMLFQLLRTPSCIKCTLTPPIPQKGQCTAVNSKINEHIIIKTRLTWNSISLGTCTHVLHCSTISRLTKNKLFNSDF